MSVDRAPGLDFKANRDVSRRKVLTRGAKVLAGGVLASLGLTRLKSLDNHPPRRPTTRETQGTVIVYSPDELVERQNEGNFDAIRAHVDDQLLRVNEEGHEVLEDRPDKAEVVKLRMGLHDGRIVIRRTTNRYKDEGATFMHLNGENEDLLKILNGKEVAVVRFLGSDYPHDSKGNLNEYGLDGGAWYSFVAAKQDAKGLSYHFVNPFTNELLPQGESPYFFSASFASPEGSAQQKVA